MLKTRDQRGLTFISILMILVIIGFVALVTMKLVPVYLESFKVTGALNGIANDPEVTSWSKKEIRKRFVSRMDIEDVDRFNQSNVGDYMEITKTKDSVSIALDYEAETALFGNVSLLIYFSNLVEAP